MSKKVLLASTDSFQLYKLIVKNLEYLGYEVVHIEDAGYPFKYKSIFQRVENLFRKIFKGDKAFKVQLRKQFLQDKQKEIIQSHGKFDFAVVIRADFFSKEILEAIRRKTDLIIGYHFDGVGRDEKVLDYVSLFDRFYVFDPTDLLKYPDANFLYAPNFYFDYPEPPQNSNIGTAYQVYYVSTYHESRAEFMVSIHQKLVELFPRVKFVVVCNRHATKSLPAYFLENMEIAHQHISFEEQLKHISNADLILDLVIDSHAGFSFRIFEGLKFEKKVVTTNPKVEEADFYDAHNFFILRKDNMDELADFLKLPYKRMDNALRAKYSFSAWLNAKITKF